MFDPSGYERAAGIALDAVSEYVGGRLVAQGRLDQAARESQRHRVQAPGAVAGKVAAGLAARSDPELGRRQAEQLELAVV